MPYLELEKKNEYQRQWVAARRKEFFLDKRCAKCGSDIDLELDHIDPSTKVSHAIWSWSKRRRDEELLKCQVLCNRCHKAKTSASHIERREHGTKAMYDNGGCRCNHCKRSNADDRAAYRKRTGHR